MGDGVHWFSTTSPRTCYKRKFLGLTCDLGNQKPSYLCFNALTLVNRTGALMKEARGAPFPSAEPEHDKRQPCVNQEEAPDLLAP